MILENFADKKANLVDETEIIDTIKNRISKYGFNLKSGNKYYKLLESRDLDIIKKYKYLVCFNLKQPQTYLYLTTINDRKYCFFIDNEYAKIYSVKYRFNESLYSGTLLEGELINISKQKNLYIIGDIIAYGDKACDKPFDARYALIKDIFKNKYKSDIGLDVCRIVIKDFIDYLYLQSFATDYKNKVPYQRYICGLIFRSVANNKNIIVVLNKNKFHDININNKLTPVIQEDKEILKISNKCKEAIFQIKMADMPDIYHLSLYDSQNQLYKYGLASVRTRQDSKMIKSWFTSASNTHKCLCIYDEDFKKWKPIALSDKEINNIRELSIE
jgi:hypothetical protein